jgi:hypothetical protein
MAKKFLPRRFAVWVIAYVKRSKIHLFVLSSALLPGIPLHPSSASPAQNACWTAVGNRSATLRL